MADKPTLRELQEENEILHKKLDAQNIDIQFENFFENNKAVMLEIDVTTKKILNANAAAVKFYGFQKDVLLNKTINDLNTLPDDEIKKLMEKALRKKSNFFEFKHKTAKGAVKDVEVYASSFYCKDNSYMFVTVLDITEHKQAENEIVKKNKEYETLNEEYAATNEELIEKNEEYATLNEEYKSQNENLIKAKEAAEESEIKFRQMTELLPQVIYECDINGKLTYVNKRAFEFYRYTQEDFEKGINFEQALIPEEVEEARKNIQKVFTGEEINNFEYTALRKDGTTFPALIYSSPIFRHNKPAGFRGVIIDISDIKNTEEELRIQNKKLNLITEIEKIGTFDWDLKTNSAIWNDEMFVIHGIPKQVPMPYENWKKCIHPEDKEITASILAESIQTKSPRYAEFRIVRPNGEIRYVRASAAVITDNKGTVTNSVGLTKDITEQTKAEQELISAKEKAEENEAKFKSIFDLSPQPISISSLTGELIEVNNKLCDISKYSKNELLGKKTVDLGFYSAEARAKFLNTLKETGQAENLELKFYDKNKSGIDTLTNATIIKLKGVPHILSMVADITKRKKAEAEIIRSKEKAEESDRLKTEFINNMSHEIRTPMNGILGFSELLGDSDLTPEKQSNYITIIKNSGKQLMRIIDDILEISKLETKQVKAVNKQICLNDLFIELFSIFDIKAKENNIPLYLKKGLPDKESTIITDSSKLSKILSNLLENALKFTNTGFVEFGYRLKNNFIEIFVKDTGIGIKPEKQKSIFERFSQEDKGVSEHLGGLGLGLSIAKENTELLGGTIFLESKKGKGSVFYINIPYKPANSGKKTINKNIHMENIKTNTILVAEDEEVNYIYIETLLEYFEKDIIILHATDGEQAIKLCKERADIDFVLMDLKMPNIDGYEATKQIKKFRPNLPIIAQTAYSTPEEKAKALSAGCDDFISKPISKEIFSKIINKYKTY
ncbi:MAG: PAS domain S-box protein [Chlorobi bacterium]|nr:PAS domain S-box protein [Chlorobiota bacterium]